MTPACLCLCVVQLTGSGYVMRCGDRETAACYWQTGERGGEKFLNHDLHLFFLDPIRNPPHLIPQTTHPPLHDRTTPANLPSSRHHRKPSFCSFSILPWNWGRSFIDFASNGIGVSNGMSWGRQNCVTGQLIPREVTMTIKHSAAACWWVLTLLEALAFMGWWLWRPSHRSRHASCGVKYKQDLKSSSCLAETRRESGLLRGVMFVCLFV
jgi:hypothetical protein